MFTAALTPDKKEIDPDQARTAKRHSSQNEMTSNAHNAKNDLILFFIVI